jgi:hypothetical protein
MVKNFKFFKQEQIVERQFLNEMFHINIICEDDDVVSWEETMGNITNDQTIYIIELLMRHNYLPTDEPIRNIMVVSSNDGVEDVIDVFPTDIHNESVIDENGRTICPVIPLSTFITLQ